MKALSQQFQFCINSKKHGQTKITALVIYDTNDKSTNILIVSNLMQLQYYLPKYGIKNGQMIDIFTQNIEWLPGCVTNMVNARYLSKLNKMTEMPDKKSVIETWCQKIIEGKIRSEELLLCPQG